MEAEGVSVEIADIFLGIASFFTVALGNIEIFINTREVATLVLDTYNSDLLISISTCNTIKP